MRTEERDLPKNIYRSGQHGLIAVIRHNGYRYALGNFKTVEDAQAAVDAFRAENPRRESKKWKSGDVLP
jgi:hypothetical protein